MPKQRRPMSIVALAALLICWLVLPALGADQGYQDFNPQSQEQVSAPLFVIISYSAIWLCTLGYLVAIWRRQSRLQDDLKQLKRLIESED